MAQTPLPVFFRKSQPYQKNFSYADIQEGTGNVIYYGAFMSPDPTASGALLTVAIPSNLAKSNEGTVNFDTTAFNLPRTAKGTAYFSAGFVQTQNDSMNIQVQLQKISATNVVSNVSALTGYTNKQINTTDPDYLNENPVLFEIPITRTNIKKGEKLRLALTFGAGGSTLTVGHDPLDRNVNTSGYNTETTIMRLIMPYSIDI